MPITERVEFKESGAPQASQANPDSQNVYYAIAFLIIVASLSCVQQTITTQSKELKANTANQDALVKAISLIKFKTLPPNPSPTQIHLVSEINKMLSQDQEDLQAQLISLRQGAQIMMTGGNTAVNAMEQNANCDSTLLNTIHEILTLIQSMAPGKGKHPQG